jgi:translation initiation factor 2B subunit (eIF-2B alpha/beta/delta family)
VADPSGGAAAADAILRDALARVRADRAHGASWLAREAARALAQAAAHALDQPASAAGPPFASGSWRQAAHALAHARPSMAAIAVTVARIYAASLDLPAPGADPSAADGWRAALTALRAAADHLAAAWDAAADAIAQHARPLLTGTILTHSRSGTVERTLLQLAADPAARLASVVVTRSLPGGEGADLARALAAAGLPVTLVADAAVGLMAGQVDCVVLGADSLRADGALVNKVGSYPLALAARAANRPVYVLSETLKIAPDGWPLSLEEGDPAAVLPAPIAGVVARNVVFDVTPARLISAIITERGALRPDELRPFAERAARELAALDAGTAGAAAGK